MSPTTESQSQSRSPSSKSEMNMDKDASSHTQQQDDREMTKEEVAKMFREARIKNNNMTPEEKDKAYPWRKLIKMTPANEVPQEFWDEI